MARNPVAARLAAIYAELPTVNCQGACHDTCTAIAMTGIERRRIYRATGTQMENLSHRDVPDGYRCPLLRWNRCSVYDLRPFICRLWGVTELLPCNFGCRPTPRWLTAAESFTLMARVWDLDGDRVRAAGLYSLAASPVLTHRGATPVLRMWVAGQISLDEARARLGELAARPHRG